MKDFEVFVKRSPNDYRGAIVNFSAIHNLHWDNTLGNGNSCFQYFVFGLIDTESIIDGDMNLPRSRAMLKVVVLRKENEEHYTEIIKNLPKRPLMEYARPEGQPPCSKKLIQIANEKKSIKRTELRQQLLDIGYQNTTIRNAIKRLSKNKKISVVGNHWTNEVIELMNIG